MARGVLAGYAEGRVGMMCRVYKAKAGWYVRLCYYHGERRGERVPVPIGFELERRHYSRKASPSQKTVKRVVAPIRRCTYCGCVLSRHNRSGICTFCTEHPERRPAAQKAE